MLLIAALALLWPFNGSTPVKHRYGEVAHWKFHLTDDRFSGVKQCQITRGPIQVEKGFVRFQLGRSADSADAIYSIDGQPPQNWTVVSPELVKAGIDVEEDNLSNPSGGVVFLPLEMVRDAHEVRIRASGWVSPRIYKISGLPTSLDLAKEQGCDVTSAR